MTQNPWCSLSVLVPSLILATTNQPAHCGITVQSVRWDNQKLEHVNLLDSGAEGVSFSGSYKLPMMYLITVPEGFDGLVVLESNRNLDFRIQAWPECPTFEILSRGTFKHVSMGNTISFKNTEPKSSTLYLSVRAHTSIPSNGLPFTLTIRSLGEKNTPKK